MQSTHLKKIPGICHDFGDAVHSMDSELLSGWEKKAPRWKQVHGKSIQEIHTPLQNAGEVDGLWTQAVDLPIAVRTADCVPILLAKKDGSTVAALHAGWKGTLAKIVEAFSDQVQGLHGWIAAVGPCISMAHYQVSAQIIEKFRKTFPDHDPSLFSDPQNHLNLAQVNRLELTRCGAEEVDLIEQCTFSTPSPNDSHSYRFHSYRRNKADDGRQHSVIMKISS